MAKSPAIGIDLGTTYSCVGFWKNDRIEIIANEQGNRTTPSSVAFTSNDTLVGDAAFNQAGFNPINTIFDAKRLIGGKYSDETVQNDLKHWPFKVICGADNKPMISVTHKGEKKEFSAVEISSLVLIKMKEIAESFIGSEVRDAVITVPAYFGQSQRVATMEAGKLAGINVLRIINEPTAAAIAYGLDFFSRITGISRNVLIFDLGGGTFDVSLLAIQKDKIEVKAVGGDTHLGGQDFDNRVVEHFTKEIKRKHGKDITQNPRAVRRLRTACERGKRLLSCTTEALIEVFFDSIEFSSVLTRSKFEELNADLFDRCIQTVERILMDAKMEKKDVHDVVLVGGSSRILKIQQMVRGLLDKKELCRNINPDEAVAYGAAFQAAVLSGQASDKIINIILSEVTPLSIGVGTGHVGEGVMVVAIPRNSIIPTTKTIIHVNGSDNQSNVIFDIYEGERALCQDNKLLGVIEFTDIKIGPRGSSSFEVSYDLQSDGFLNVSAKYEQTGQRKSITIGSERSSGQEIETMMKNAELHKEEDEKVKEKNKARRDLFHLVCEKRDAVKSNRRIPRDVKKRAEDTIAKAFQWMDMRKELAEVSEYEAQKKLLTYLF